MGDLNSRTVDGTLAFCDYLIAKGYATTAQINPWRTAIQKVFEAVEGEGYTDLDLAAVDLNEYMSRFRTLAGAQYKAESITAYGRRVQNAIEAHEYYLANGRPPTFRQGGAKKAKKDTEGTAPVVKLEPKPTTTAPAATGGEGLIEFPFVLKSGRMIVMKLPARLTSDDVNRLSGFLRTLQDDPQEQRQIPKHTGSEREAA